MTSALTRLVFFEGWIPSLVRAQSRGSSTNLFSLHMAVRKASAALGGEAVATHGQAHFVTYVFQQLDQWARMFYTHAWELPLSLAREAGPDILAAFKLAGNKSNLCLCVLHLSLTCKAGPKFFLS